MSTFVLQLTGRLNLTYYHSAKTAGTSIRSWLANHADADTKLVKLPADQSLVELKSSYYIPLSFTVVRNPWDRMVSVWSYGQDRGWNFQDIVPAKTHQPTFKEFAHSLCDLDQESVNIATPLSKLTQDVDITLRFENLDKDFEQIQSLLSTAEPLPHLKASQRERNYKHYYDHETRSIIGDLFAMDIAQYGYSY